MEVCAPLVALLPQDALSLGKLGNTLQLWSFVSLGQGCADTRKRGLSPDTICSSAGQQEGRIVEGLFLNCLIAFELCLTQCDELPQTGDFEARRLPIHERLLQLHDVPRRDGPPQLHHSSVPQSPKQSFAGLQQLLCPKASPVSVMDGRAKVHDQVELIASGQQGPLQSQLRFMLLSEPLLLLPLPLPLLLNSEPCLTRSLPSLSFLLFAQALALCSHEHLPLALLCLPSLCLLVLHKLLEGFVALLRLRNLYDPAFTLRLHSLLPLPVSPLLLIVTLSILHDLCNAFHLQLLPLLLPFHRLLALLSPRLRFLASLHRDVQQRILLDSLLLGRTRNFLLLQLSESIAPACLCLFCQAFLFLFSFVEGLLLGQQPSLLHIQQVQTLLRLTQQRCGDVLQAVTSGIVQHLDVVGLHLDGLASDIATHPSALVGGHFQEDLHQLTCLESR
mmetsp:Transcript_20155/g.47175  ORF Transcript_20155/g.47175 Transcript_20155/m.47175 type:complete len:447 (+) Transcript_20155:1282-2622(+)